MRSRGKGVLIDNDILTVADLANTLKQPEEKIIELLEAAVLPGRRVGDAWYVTRRQLLAYIEGETVEPAPRRSVPAPSGPNIVPFGGDWVCNKCDTLNDVERVACKRCGATRMMPLMGFRRRP